MPRPWHPLLFGIYPVLLLFAGNVDEVPLADLLPTLPVVLLLALVVFGIASLLLRDRWRGALLATPLLILFYAYGWLHERMGRLLGPDGLGRHRILLALMVLTAVGLGILLHRWKGSPARPTRILNVFGGALVLTAVGMSTVGLLGGVELPEGCRCGELELQPPDPAPDIYYVVLDAYAREDVLRELYGHDNRPFLSALEERGFVVLPRSRSNYHQTDFSLPTVLNMDYLDRLVDGSVLRASEGRILREMLHRNRVVCLLRRAGYEFVGFATGVTLTEIEDADIYASGGWGPAPFHNAVLDMTPLTPVLHRLGRPAFNFELHCDRVEYALDHMADYAGGESPRFVFVHVLAPHAPFVFDAQGGRRHRGRGVSSLDGNEYVERWGAEEYVTGYRGQLRFLNARILDAVDRILASPRPSIIVLQGDHGPRLGWNWSDLESSDPREATAILNAWYLPGDPATALPVTMTPVNTFRTIFREYFHAPLEDLQDRCFVSPGYDRYRFVDVTAATEPTADPSEKE